MELIRSKTQPSGFKFSIAEKGNTHLGDGKKKAIIDALNSTWTEGVYQTKEGKIIQVLLNGVIQTLYRDYETGTYYFRQ